MPSLRNGLPASLLPRLHCKIAQKISQLWNRIQTDYESLCIKSQSIYIQAWFLIPHWSFCLRQKVVGKKLKSRERQKRHKFVNFKRDKRDRGKRIRRKKGTKGTNDTKDTNGTIRSDKGDKEFFNSACLIIHCHRLWFLQPLISYFMKSLCKYFSLENIRIIAILNRRSKIYI